MNTEIQKYQCAVIGGGLAGLCLAVQLADRGISVVLFEKNQYPFHKVCGEYISMESWDFLTKLGVPLTDLALPRISSLGISSQNGFMLDRSLKMGGFGISRYSLDFHLSQLAKEKGVCVLENCKVNGVRDHDLFHLIETSKGTFQAEIVCGSYGKYTPVFMHEDADHKAADGQYIGVKYHIRTDLAQNRIELHNFKDGYCGVSKVDQDWYCLCYLTTARNLKENDKDIRLMEENVLHKNPFLKRYFTESDFVRKEPLVISNVHFRKKQTESGGMFLLGDAAGSITPLCGNGMSMGMRASNLLAAELIPYFNKKQTREQANFNYKRSWNASFSIRITSGFYLQHLFGQKTTTHLTLRILDHFPSLTDKLVSLTHGETF
jgi:flavin-dependent dehydrogenase